MNNIQKIKKSERLIYSEISKRSGISVTELKNIAHGNSVPKVTTAWKIVYALNQKDFEKVFPPFF